AYLSSCIVLRGRLRGFEDLVSGLGFFNRWKEIFCRDDKTGKFFYTDSNNSWQKRVSRGFLSIGSTTEFIKLLDAVRLINLGRIAVTTIGNLPVLKAVKNSAIIISAIFGIWDNSMKLSKSNKNKALINGKVEKWAKLADALQPPKKGIT